MNVPAEYRGYLLAVGFVDFVEPFTVVCFGREYEFLSSDGKEIKATPTWDAITSACETAIGIDVSKVTKNLDELKGLIASLDMEHRIYLKGFPPYKAWELENFRARLQEIVDSWNRQPEAIES